MDFQHRLLSVWGVLIFHVAPGLPALDISQPPAAQVCGWLGPVRPPSPPQVPGRYNKNVQSSEYTIGFLDESSTQHMIVLITHHEYLIISDWSKKKQTTITLDDLYLSKSSNVK